MPYGAEELKAAHDFTSDILDKLADILGKEYLPGPSRIYLANDLDKPVKYDANVQTLTFRKSDLSKYCHGDTERAEIEVAVARELVRYLRSHLTGKRSAGGSYAIKAEKALAEIIHEFELPNENPYSVVERASRRTKIEKEYELGLRASLGMALGMVKAPRDKRKALIQYFLREPDEKKILYGLEKLGKIGDMYIEKMRPKKLEAERAWQSEKQLEQPIAAKTAVIIFLALVGAFFLFPQIPNRITAAIVSLPTSALLSLNFVVAILVILLIYVFSREKESLNH